MQQPMSEYEHIQFEIAQGDTEPDDDCYEYVDTAISLTQELFEYLDETRGFSNRFPAGQSPNMSAEEDFEWFIREWDEGTLAEYEAARSGPRLQYEELPFTPPADNSRSNIPSTYEVPAVNEGEEILFDYSDSFAINSAKVATRLRRNSNRRAKQKTLVVTTNQSVFSKRKQMVSITDQKTLAVRSEVEDIEENLAQRYEWLYDEKKDERYLAERTPEDISKRNDELVEDKEKAEQKAVRAALRRTRYASGIGSRTDSSDTLQAQKVLARDSKIRKSHRKFNPNRHPWNQGQESDSRKLATW